MGRYEEVFTRSIEAPEEFWGRAAARIDWTKRWDRVLDDSTPPFYRWFPGGGLNTCHNCLDRHVDKGRADVPALIYDSPVTSTIERFTYRELRDRVALFAGALVDLGVGKGDTVVIYMSLSTGRWKRSTTSVRGMSSGPPPTWAGSWATPTSSTGHS